MEDQFHTENEYTTPSGGYGYVYTPQSSGGKGGKTGRTLIIVMAVVLAVLFVGCCLLGAFLVRSTAGSAGNSEGEGTTTDFDTRGGMFIVIDPEAASSAQTAETSESLTQTGDGSSDTTAMTGSPYAADGVISAKDPVPDTITVTKRSPARKDADGDGKADIALDGNGYVLTSAGGNILPAATVVYKVADSVVEITTETIVQSGRIGQYITSGAGSGVIISREGFIITNNHVIEGADSITVSLTDGTRYEAVLVGTDAVTDIALLWIDAGDRALNVATLGSSFDLAVGEGILAIGNPLGSLGGTVTEGIISATERQIRIDGSDMTLLQISAPINPGNSGGGLFNMAGELVGIVNAKYSEDDVEGLGFAIPVDTAYDIIQELYQYGYVRGRATTGLTLVDVTSSYTAMQYFGSRYTGVYVYESALTDELRYGDLILTFDGREITSSSQITEAVRSMSVGDSVVMVVYRNGSKISVTLTLEEDKPTISSAQT